MRRQLCFSPCQTHTGNKLVTNLSAEGPPPPLLAPPPCWEDLPHSAEPRPVPPRKKPSSTGLCAPRPGAGGSDPRRCASHRTTCRTQTKQCSHSTHVVERKAGSGDKLFWFAREP